MDDELNERDYICDHCGCGCRECCICDEIDCELCES